MFQLYKFGFDLWACLLFIVIMIPNIIWFKFPAKNDILRCTSSTPKMDKLASICQVAMIFVLCVFINSKSLQLCITPLLSVVIICCLLYYINWLIYYFLTVNTAVIISLALFPCLAFLFFAIERNNYVAMIFILIFTICHFLSSMINFKKNSSRLKDV